MPINVKPNQYYGYITHDDKTYHVVCIKPAGVHNPQQWIGKRNIKFSDMLCIDDIIINNLSMSVDWSSCNVSH